MNATVVSQPLFLEPTFRRAATVWWAFLWRGVLLGFGAGFVVGFVEGFVGALAGIPSTTIRVLTMASGAIVCIPVGIYVVQLVLRKSFGGFSIRLVASGASMTS